MTYSLVLARTIDEVYSWYSDDSAVNLTIFGDSAESQSYTNFDLTDQKYKNDHPFAGLYKYYWEANLHARNESSLIPSTNPAGH